jgi:alginate O-acetyltransferase complex protein AlgI
VLFNSYAFLLLFLPLAVLGFYLLRQQKYRLALLVIASYVFYAWTHWWLPLLMLSSTLIAFVGGLLIEKVPVEKQRKLLLATGIAGCLLLLVYFKYAAFGTHYFSSFVEGLTGRGFPGLVGFARTIVLPAGISFYTFECVSYLVDIYRGELDAEKNPLRFAVFISFFPHLIAGPIVRYRQLRPQLEVRAPFDAEQFRSGLVLVGLGLAKKVLLADQIATLVDFAYRNPAQLGFLDAWTAAIGFAFQIYFDFGGYSDMALGLARMFGITLPWNFDRPYRATSPRDFWRRWHVTLSTWLRDYLYIPLGGNRKSPARRDLNLLATMGLGGLWHGASLNFVVWGLYHGVLLGGSHRLAGKTRRLPHVLSMAVTFVLVTIGWVFFRLGNAHAIGKAFAAMGGLSGHGVVYKHLVLYIAAGSVLMWGLPEERTWKLEGWGLGRLGLAGAVVAFALVSMNQTRTFLYFRF